MGGSSAIAFITLAETKFQKLICLYFIYLSSILLMIDLGKGPTTIFITILLFVNTHFDLDLCLWLLLLTRFSFLPSGTAGSNIVLVRVQKLSKSSSLIRNCIYNDSNDLSLEFPGGPHHADRHGEIYYIPPLRGFVHFLFIYGP